MSTLPRAWRIALLTFLAVAASTSVSAQTHQGDARNLESIRGTVWLTDSGGREVKTRIVDVSGGVVTTIAGGETRRLRTTDVVRVRVPHSDPLLNGALIGAGAAVASGLLLCRATEPWENCRDDIGPMLGFGAIGAGVGIGIDALIRGRRTIYEAVPGSARLRASPIIGRHAGGLRISLSF